jgi:membrane associated rhomboid family serine protease
MNEAERANESGVETKSPRASFVRAVVISSLALYFLQLTVLAPSDVEAALGFSSGSLGQRWWTVITFPVAHSQFLPLVANLLTIGVFGSHLERRWGTGEYARYFAVCALGAWITAVAVTQPTAVLSGAAAPAVGTLLAFAAVSGSGGLFRIGAVALSAGWLATAGTIAILLAGMTVATGEAALTYLVHGAGLIAGWAYLRTAGSINLTRIRDGMSHLPDEPEEGPPRAIPKHHARAQQPAEDDIVARSNAALARETATREEAAPRRRDPSALDRVLDKISAQGLESLTSDERKLLDDLSRRLRDP